MTTTTINPDSLVALSGVTVTGTSAFAALSDASDTTYVDFNASSNNLVVGFSTFTLPAGAVIRTVTNFYRASYPTTPPAGYNPSINVYRNTASYYGNSTLTTTIQQFGNQFNQTPAGLPTTQSDLDNYRLQFGMSGAYTGSPNIRVFKAWADIDYVGLPSTTATGPTGLVNTTTSPTVTWTHTPDASAHTGQNGFDVRIFTAAQYGIGGFDPLVSPATWTTHVTGSDASVVTGPLPNNTTFRAYVRTSQLTNGVEQWAPFSFVSFNIALTTPDIASTVATVDSPNGRNQIVVTHAGASAAWELVDVQATYDGGVTWVPVRGWTQMPVTGEVMTAYDYEAPGGVPVTYRARATRHASGLLVTGNWTLSSPITWAYNTECHMWLKDPTTPANSMLIEVAAMPEPLYDRTVGIFRPIGATFPVGRQRRPPGGGGHLVPRCPDPHRSR